MDKNRPDVDQDEDYEPVEFSNEIKELDFNTRADRTEGKFYESLEYAIDKALDEDEEEAELDEDMLDLIGDDYHDAFGPND